MKPWQLKRRVGDLSKLEPVPSDVLRLDFDSFTEPDKQLFRKVWEIQAKYCDYLARQCYRDKQGVHLKSHRGHLLESFEHATTDPDGTQYFRKRK